jgi:hypothetical protein
MQVRILGIEGEVSATRAHAGYLRYRVSLPDGDEAHFTSASVYQPGRQVRVIASRGCMTGRLFLDDPSVDVRGQ